MRSALDQVADSEQPVGVEVERAERVLKGSEAPVHVPDHEITPARVGAELADGSPRHGQAPVVAGAGASSSRVSAADRMVILSPIGRRVGRGRQ